MIDERFCNPISTGELERRWKAVRGAMPEQKLDALTDYSANGWPNQKRTNVGNRQRIRQDFHSFLEPRFAHCGLVGGQSTPVQGSSGDSGLA